MANYDYEIVNGRKIRVRPKETVSEIDKNGYFRRQPNHFTTPFGDGENDLKAEGNKRYRLVWAKLCHWSNRAAIARELEGLEDQISVNMVEHAPHEKNLGWEYVYNENNIDPVFGDQFLSEAYYRADDDYQGRTTVPALIDTTTGKVVNNDYNWLTTYFEVNFRPWHKKGGYVRPYPPSLFLTFFPSSVSRSHKPAHRRPQTRLRNRSVPAWGWRPSYRISPGPAG